jgi:hypothetical protein
MRVLFIVLVLANVGFFAWSRYFAPTQASADAVLVRRNEPEKLKIVPPAPPNPAPVGGCLEWGAFALAESSRAEKALEPLALGSRLVSRRADETAAGWWVFVPSQGTRQAALKKAAELKELGIADYYIMGEEADSPWSLSLGLFRSEQAALARLAELREQGVRSALVGPRNTVVPRIWLQVKGVDSALEPRLKEIARQIEGSELRACSSR